MPTPLRLISLVSNLRNLSPALPFDLIKSRGFGLSRPAPNPFGKDIIALYRSNSVKKYFFYFWICRYPFLHICIIELSTQVLRLQWCRLRRRFFARSSSLRDYFDFVIETLPALFHPVALFHQKVNVALNHEKNGIRHHMRFTSIGMANTVLAVSINSSLLLNNLLVLPQLKVRLTLDTSSRFSRSIAFPTSSFLRNSFILCSSSLRGGLGMEFWK